MNPWLLSVLALLVAGILEWVRRRKASRASSLVWRFIICLLLAGAVIPIRFSFDGPTQTLPVIAMLLFDTGFDPKAALMDVLIIGVAAVILCAIWSSVVYLRRARK